MAMTFVILRGLLFGMLADEILGLCLVVFTAFAALGYVIDHGLAAYVPAVQSDVEPRHPHVVDLLNDWSLRAASLRYAAEREVRS